MPLNPSLLEQEIKTAVAPWNGVQIGPFAKALGTGIVLALTGKLKFSTQDTGTTPGTGVGVGIGIKNLPDAQVSALIFSKGESMWAPARGGQPTGKEWKTFCDKIAKAVKQHIMINALLTSTHTPVFAGVGTVKKYYGVVPAAMQSTIVQAAPPAWAQARFPELALAVATGIVQTLTTFTPSDVVVITGAGGAPVPGSGSGSGVVT